MSTLPELIEQCQAAPDDDAPRLAWASRVGGERGELVVVQCQLASGAWRNRDEWRRLRARERELLAANGRAWSGLAGEYPSNCVFRRGFVDAYSIVCTHDCRLDRIVNRVPLARSVGNDLHGDIEKLLANPRCAKFPVLKVSTSAAVIQQLVDQGPLLRALSISQASRDGARLLAESGLLARVERLVLGSVEDGEQIIAAAPRLRALYIRDPIERYAAAIPQTVVELGCAVTGGIEMVATLAIAPTLQRLRLAAQEFAWDFDALAKLRSLRSLDLSDAKPGPIGRPFVITRPGELPPLRELSLGLWFEPDFVELVAPAFGPQLDTLHWSGRSLPHERSIKAMLADHNAPLEAGDAAVAAHVDGEFVIGLFPPWAKRPLEFADNTRGPWFEGGGVSIRS